ncbi:unnamed protein product [Knipowitschia caucasica]|uniref:Corticotropin-releasing factor domain-containing protein n=1 Tax=Knipowitschia caucasica TaxID=637954 RepID=A0AAV2M2Q9_KNICA
MSAVSLCPCLLLLLLSGPVQSQSLEQRSQSLEQGSQTDLLAFNVLNLNSLLQAEHRSGLRQIRVPRLPPQVPLKRAQQGSRFALSLDVPTSILSVLIDLAKNKDMRSKAAANAQLMARIGRR